MGRFALITGVCILCIALTIAFFAPIRGTLLYIQGRAMLVRSIDTVDRQQLGRAYSLLAEARRLNPTHVEVQRAFAQAALRSDQPLEAIAALETAYRYDPAHILLQYELATAYEQAGDFVQAKQIFYGLGIQLETMRYNGDLAMGMQKYAEADLWYLRAMQSAPEAASRFVLPRAVAQLYEGNGSPAHIATSPFATILNQFTLEPNSSLQIEGAKFTRFDGSLLPDTAGDGSGIFWWSGPAFAVVDVVQAGSYKIHAHILHSSPPPVIVHIAINGKVVRSCSFERADQSWESCIGEVEFAKGRQIILVSFLNDGQLGTENRDARMAWVSLRPR